MHFLNMHDIVNRPVVLLKVNTLVAKFLLNCPFNFDLSITYIYINLYTYIKMGVAHSKLVVNSIEHSTSIVLCWMENNSFILVFIVT